MRFGTSFSWRTIWRSFAFALPLLSLTYLVRFRVAGLPSTLFEVLLLVFVVGALLIAGRSGLVRAHQVLHVWRWPIVAWILATLIAVVGSPSLWTGLGLWRAYVLEPLSVLVALCTLLDQPGDRRRMEQGMMFAAIVVCVWAIIGFFGNWGIPKPWNVAINAGRRAVGPFGFPNAVALFIAPIGALAATRLALMFKECVAWRERVLSIVTLVFVTLGLALAKSDGGMLAFGFVVMLSLLGLRWGRWLVLVGAVAGGVGLIALPGVREALVKEATFQGWSGKVRLIMWRETWAMLKKHWFFGAGFGGYPKVFDAYHKARFIEIFQYPHNNLFTFWSETGLLGVLAFVGIMVTWVKDALRTTRATLKAMVSAQGIVFSQTNRYLPMLVLVAPLITIFIHGLVDVPYFKNDLALLFWMFTWLIIAAKNEGAVTTQKLA